MCIDWHIDQLEMGILYEGLGMISFIEDRNYLRMSTRKLDLRKTLDSLNSTRIDILKMCTRHYPNSTCSIMEHSMNQELLELFAMYELTIGSRSVNKRGLGDIVLGLFGLETIDPTRIESVNRLFKNQEMIAGVEEVNRRGVINNAKFITQVEEAEEEQTKFINKNLKRHSDLINSMISNLTTLNGKITLFVNLELLEMEFHRNVQHMRQTMKKLCSFKDSYMEISENEARLLVNDESTWKNFTNHMGSKSAISMRHLDYVSYLEEDKIVTVLRSYILENKDYTMLKITTVPKIVEDQMIFPDTHLKFLAMSSDKKDFSSFSDLTGCKPTRKG